MRLRRDGELRRAADAWLDAEPQRPADVKPADWLSFEQSKHERLLAALARRNQTPTVETV